MVRPPQVRALSRGYYGSAAADSLSIVKMSHDDVEAVLVASEPTPVPAAAPASASATAPEPDDVPQLGEIGDGLSEADAKVMISELHRWSEVFGTLFSHPDGAELALFRNDSTFAVFLRARGVYDDCSDETIMHGWRAITKRWAAAWLSDAVTARCEFEKTAPEPVIESAADGGGCVVV